MQVYENLIEALSDLKSRGFTTDFKLSFNAVEFIRTGINLSPSYFEIVEHYRFEADTNPDESSIIYATQSVDGKIKGVLVNAYGIYSDDLGDAMIQKLKVQHPSNHY
jgi:hypothetical protein